MSREVQLAAVPDGLPGPEHFVLAEVPLPTPDDGQVLVRNRFFHVFAALRTLIGGGVKDAPVPPLRPGDTLVGPAIGQVVSAPGESGLRAGDLVSHWLGWREYALVPVGQVAPLGDALPDPVAHLSQGGFAYAALTRDAEVRPGDTVFVSGAAGGVGSLAGQIARLLGAGRVIGSTGSPQKADRLVRELGYDATVIRGAAPIEEQLAKAAPDGIDVYVDNVGGDQLRAAVTAARPGARFVLIGALSGQMSPHGTGGAAPVELDTYQLILKRISIRAFQGFDEQARSQWLERFGGWSRTGDITFPYVRVSGIDHAPRALREMIEGRHFGTVIVEP
ncbi:MDR family NADP-dependent oxidoreductase [Nonomuraea cavernae]|uniref:MDR family NADP-dependent oxidoreductase n=1 Tax=Nonomuraea cavernae TaxID=2045107 RepID=UPI001CD9AA8B|nr:NADP-dependent oxidoreductase [Nonomuraea cavernae]MCA2184751.1 NADP-dependent oxidoreductase [Nonomuraea cavernae]